MKVVVDTNILARLFIEPDSAADEEQRAIAEKLLRQFEEIIIPTHVFCELSWILSKRRYEKNEIHSVFRHLIETDKITCKEAEVNAGMALLENGGDFADGVNEYSGRMLAGHGASVFATFDKQAVQLLTERGIAAMIPRL